MRMYNSYMLEHKNPFGAIRTNTECTFSVRIPNDVYVNALQLMVCPWGDWNHPIREEPMPWKKLQQGENIFSCTISLQVPGVYGYCFRITKNGKTNLIKRNPRTNEGFYSYNLEGWHWKLTCYDANFRTPDFAKQGVMYQIFPDRFYKAKNGKTSIPDSIVYRQDWGEMPVYMPDENGIVRNNDFFGGNLKGIEEKLPYLKSLGVSNLYLMPIVESAENHGYSTANYEKVNPLLGDWDDFESLAKKAHQMGIHILLDGVFSHTGSESIYFNKSGKYPSLGAYQSTESPYFSWYTFDRRIPCGYRTWWGFDTLPELNKWSPKYQKYIFGDNGIIDLWFEKGADGLRLDVVDELPDEFLTPLAQKVKSYSDKVLYGEVWEDAVTKEGYGKRREYLLGKQLDSVMNYPFKNAILSYVRYGGVDGSEFYNTIMNILESYPKPAVDCLMNFLSTHDTIRAITALAGEELERKSNYVEERKEQARLDSLSKAQYRLGKKRLKIATMLQYFLPGIPCVYYGDEAGLMGYKDPFNRKCYPWGRRDKNLVNFYKKLGKIRKENPFLAEAEFAFLRVDTDICIWERKSKEHNMFIAVNRSGSKETIVIPEEYQKGKVMFTIKKCTKKNIETTLFLKKNKIELDAYDGIILCI